MKKTFSRISLSVRIALAVLVITLGFSSCRKEILQVNSTSSYTAHNFNDIFEGFWNGMNNNYVFWSEETTNWDAVYTKYKPLFAKLSLIDSADNETALTYFEEMTKDLKDSHYTLTFPTLGYQISPAENRKIAISTATPDSIYVLPSAMFSSLIPKKYIDSTSLKQGSDTVYFNGSPSLFKVMSGTIKSRILYFYFSDFAFSQSGSNTYPIIIAFLNTLRNLPSTIKGIVIDVRGNGGGSITDLDFLVGNMITKPLQYGYTRSKSGNGRLDYTPWAPAIVTPQDGAKEITIPIVALADHTSVSMAEITALAINTLPNGKFIGTTTWGANGPLAPQQYYNSGQFTIGSYLSVYTSSSMFKTLDGNIYEGRGIPPGIWVRETSAAYNNGVDLQLDAAINYINSK